MPAHASFQIFCLVWVLLFSRYRIILVDLACVAGLAGAWLNGREWNQSRQEGVFYLVHVLLVFSLSACYAGYS